MRRLTAVLALALVACGASAEKRAEEIAAHDLADPAAAQFREVRQASDRCVVGELNAKNRMGAYTGFRPFIVDLEKNAVAIVPDEHDAENLDATLAATRVEVFRQDCGLQS